jgi:PBP1b-binding outer membrane lipoprotein LpoB
MESIKKPYKPKADKVEKLSKVYAELKKNAPKVSPLFKGVAKVLFLSIFFASCSAQWHLKQAVKKNPNIITEKVIRQVDTLIIRDSVVHTDTFVTKSIDTIQIENEHFKTVVYRYHDTIRVVNTLKGDTIRITKKVVMPVVQNETKYDKAFIFLGAIIFNDMANKENIKQTPSRSSPKSSKRGCLCKDTLKYSVKCCDGTIWAQGIGPITATPQE